MSEDTGSQTWTRVTSQIEAWVEQSLLTRAMGDRIKIELQFSMVPTNPDGSMLAPVVSMMLFMPGLVLGSWINAMHNFPAPLDCTLEEVDGVVGELLEAMRHARSQQGIPVMGNGHSN